MKTKYITVADEFTALHDYYRFFLKEKGIELSIDPLLLLVNMKMGKIGTDTIYAQVRQEDADLRVRFKSASTFYKSRYTAVRYYAEVQQLNSNDEKAQVQNPVE